MANRLTDSELTAICNNDIEYLDKLYDFLQKVDKINNSASGGMPILTLKSRMRGQAQTYFDLCGITSEELRSQFEIKRQGQSVNKCITVTVPKKNHIKVGPDNWLLCPKCGGKLVKHNDDSVFVNCPIWCKKCKKVIKVSWHKIAP